MFTLKRSPEFKKIVPIFAIVLLRKDSAIAQTVQPTTTHYVPTPNADPTTSFGIVISLVASIGSLLYMGGKGYIEKISQRSAIELKREEMESNSNHSMIKSITDQQSASFASLLQMQREQREDMIMAIRDSTESMREMNNSNAKILLAIEQLNTKIEGLKNNG